MSTSYSTRAGVGAEAAGSIGSAEMFQEVTVTGTPYNRGKTYGSRVPTLIEHSIATYASLFAYRRGMDWDACQEAALAYQTVLEAGASDVLEEMRGIADGSKRKLSEILALNVRTELLAGRSAGQLHAGWQEALFANSAAGVPQHPDDGGELLGASGGFGDANTDGFASVQLGGDFGECTTAAADNTATLGGTTILAQTWDWQGQQRKACVLLRIYASGQPDVLTLTEAGIVAKHGMNSEGLAVGLNMMRSKSDGKNVGMPVHVLLRMMLQARTFDEAKAIPRAHSAAASSCIVLAAKAGGGLSALEITPAGVAEVPAQNGHLAHTNNALDAGAAADEYEIDENNSTRERYQRALHLLKMDNGGGGKLRLDDFKAILRDHHGQPKCICRHPNKKLAAVDRSETVCGVIMDLGNLTMHIAPSLPCKCNFESVLMDFPMPTHGSVSVVVADSCSICVPM